MPRKRTWEEVNLDILSGLDIRSEYEALGVEVTGREPNADGWVACRAVGREDRNPSASINVRSGRYKDSGGEGLSLSLWDFAAQFGPYATWQEARKAYAHKAGVRLGRGRPPQNPADSLKFLPWNQDLVALWCLKKRPITPEAVKAAGGRLARHLDQYTVIALPIFGAAGTGADPVGWVAWNITGKELPVFQRGEKPQWVKMKTLAGSESGLMGFHAIDRAGEDPAGQIVIKTEGPGDMLALWAATPAELRDKYLPISNAGGANETPKPSMLQPFTGRPVWAVHDADQTGETGAGRWCQWLAGISPEVRHVRLPYPVTKDHGKDLRDWLNEGHTFQELVELADGAEPVRAAQNADDADGPRPIEADDDPHRLARLYLQQYATHPEHGLTLRFWREEWWQWTGTHYRRIPESQMRHELTRAVKQEFDRLNLADQEMPQDGREPPKVRKVTTGLVANIMAALGSMVGLNGESEQFSWIDACAMCSMLPDPKKGKVHMTASSYIAMQNGILDLEALLRDDETALEPHNPRWFSPVCLPYPFDPEADCPCWKATLQHNMERDAERIALLQEWAGYLLTADTSQQKFLFMEGEGANGKSVYCAGITAMLGEQNVSHVNLESFGQRFALHGTLGKLANIVTEVGELDRVAEGFLKSFTAGDRMTFDRKGLPAIEAAPTARLILSANNRPRFADRSSGIWRRMILVPFRVEIPESRRIVGMDKVAWWQQSGELPGIFDWAVAGLHRLRQQGQFTQPQLCRQALEEYRLESNPARAFLEECCAENSLDSVATYELYDEYKKWCTRNGYRPLGERQFGKEVRRRFPSVQRKNLGSRGERFYAYAGLTLNLGPGI